MVELDEDIAAVWQTILGEDAKWLADRILKFDVTVESVRAELAKPAESTKQRAFNTILRNRMFHGGIMAHGSGLIKHGENGKGLKSRCYPETLNRRIMDIASVSDRFCFACTDGIKFIRDNAGSPNASFFIDPPYTAGGKGKRAGRRLYKHNELDHAGLFDAVATIQGDFLMTYDNDAEVLTMATERGFDTEVVPMKNTHHAKMLELLIGKDLEWVRVIRKPATDYLPGFEP